MFIVLPLAAAQKIISGECAVIFLHFLIYVSYIYFLILSETLAKKAYSRTMDGEMKFQYSFPTSTVFLRKNTHVRKFSFTQRASIFLAGTQSKIKEDLRFIASPLALLFVQNEDVRIRGAKI